MLVQFICDVSKCLALYVNIVCAIALNKSVKVVHVCVCFSYQLPINYQVYERLHAIDADQAPPRSVGQAACS